MRLKNSFLGIVCMAALTLTTSCINDEPVNNGDSDNNHVGMYMTLQLIGPKTAASTKTTPGEDGTEPGTNVQNKISSLLVLLCEKNSHAIVESHVLPAGELLPITDGVSTKVILTHTGSFDVYAVANPPASMTYGVGDVLTDQTIESVTEALMKSDYAADNTFIMFNECNGTDDVAGADLTITAANTFDNPANCETIKLDRLAVQIRSKAADKVKVDDITTGNSFLTAADLQGFKLLNGATKVNLQQKWSNTKADMGTNYPWFNLLQTPNMKEGTNAGGAEYYNHLTSFRTVNIDGDGNYTVVKDLYAGIDPYSTATGTIFCMENHPTSALLGNTTGLVYQFKTTVTGSDNKAGTGCFYGYNDKYFASLAALQTAYPHAFDKAEGTESADKLAAAESELSEAYNSSDKETAISNFRVKYSVKVYTDGIMYYTYFIKDRNYKDAADGKNYYSVMRNTIYDLTVTELLKIGTDIPGGWDPDRDEPTDPVEPQNVYMVVKATVNRWVLSKEDNIQLK